jgi:hypothetical protein
MLIAILSFGGTGTVIARAGLLGLPFQLTFAHLVDTPLK